jgi:hypothetical protein
MDSDDKFNNLRDSLSKSPYSAFAEKRNNNSFRDSDGVFRNNRNQAQYNKTYALNNWFKDKFSIEPKEVETLKNIIDHNSDCPDDEVILEHGEAFSPDGTNFSWNSDDGQYRFDLDPETGKISKHENDYTDYDEEDISGETWFDQDDDELPSK